MLPQAIEIDQTPLKMLSQIVEQQREGQRQLQALQLKDEQTKMDLFGGAQKQILEITSKLPYQMQKGFVERAKPIVKNIYKAGGTLESMQQTIFDEMMNLSSEVGAVNQWTTQSEQIAKALGEKGYSPIEVEAELKRNLYNWQTDPKTGQQVMIGQKNVSELGNFDEYVQKHIIGRKGMFWDMKKGMDGVTKYTNDVKGSIVKDKKIMDPTGKERLITEVQTELYPWTKYVEDKDPITGMPMMYTVLDTSPLNDIKGNPILDSKGKPVTVISEDAYNKFVSGDPSVKATIEAGGQQLINDENRRKFGTIFPTKAQMDQGAIDPDEEGNKMIYSRLFLNDLPQIQRFKLQKDVSSSKVKDNPPPINIYNTQDQSSLPVSYQDRVNQSLLGNPEFVKNGNDVTDWFSFNIYGEKDDLKTPAKVIVDRENKKFIVTLPGKKQTKIEYSPQQFIDLGISKLSDFNYTTDPRKFRKFSNKGGNLPEGFWNNK